MGECLTTPQHKNKLAIGCQTNGIYIQFRIKYVYYLKYRNCNDSLTKKLRKQMIT